MKTTIYPLTSREAKRKGRNKVLRDMRDASRRDAARASKAVDVAAARIAATRSDTAERQNAQLDYLEAQAAHDAALAVAEFCNLQMGKAIT